MHRHALAGRWPVLVAALAALTLLLAACDGDGDDALGDAAGGGDAHHVIGEIEKIGTGGRLAVDRVGGDGHWCHTTSP